MTFQAIIAAHERMVFRGITLLLLNLVQLGGVIGVVATNSGLASTILVYHVFGSATGVLVSGFFVFRHFSDFGFQISSDFCIRLVRKSLSFFALQVSGQVYLRADIIVLKQLSTDQITGWFSASKRLLEALHLIAGALTQALYPALANRFSSNQQKCLEPFRIMFRMILLVALPAGLSFVFLARGIIEFIYGQAGFERSIYLLSALGPVAVIMICDSFVTYFSLVLKLEIPIRNLSLVRILLNLVADLALICFFKDIGAVLAAGLSCLFNLVYCLILIRGKLGPLGLLGVLPKPLKIGRAHV